MSEEQEPLLLSDHEYDGIGELNNDMPRWWVWLFYGSVVFSAVFVNVAVPTGGASSIALYVDNAARHGQSPARAASVCEHDWGSAVRCVL